VSQILNAIRSAYNAPDYVSRFEIVLFIRADFDKASLRATNDRRHTLLALTRKYGKKIEEPLHETLTRLESFRVECDGLTRLRDDSARKPKAAGFYELLPRAPRDRLEERVRIERTSPSLSIYDDPDDNSLVASIALASSDWDAVIPQAWWLSTEATHLIDCITTTCRMVPLENSGRKKSKDYADRLRQLELAFAAVVDNGLYRAPESTTLDSLLTKEIRKVSLLRRQVILNPCQR
jgi:hypothetical protein